MIYNEQVLIRMGLDTGSAATAMRSFVRTMENAVTGLKQSIVNAGKNLLAPLTIAGIGMQINKTLDYVEKLKADSEALGVSPGFLQDLNNIAIAAGIGSEKVGSLLGRFAKDLAPGTNVEQAVMALSDKLASIADPATKAKVAMDAFGKGGLDMLKIIGSGSKELAKMAAEFAKFSDSEIEALEKADAEIDKFQNKLTIYTGKILEALSFGWRVWSKINPGSKGGWGGGGFDVSATASELESSDLERSQRMEIMAKNIRAAGEQTARVNAAREALKKYGDLVDTARLSTAGFSERLSILNKRLEEHTKAAGAAADPQSWLTSMEKVVDVEEKIAKLKKEQAETEKKIADEATRKAKAESEYRSKLSDQRRNVSGAWGALWDAQPENFSLEDLAGMNTRGGLWARQILTRRRWSKENAMLGRFGLANQQADTAQRMFDQLSAWNPYLNNPQAKLLDEAVKQSEALKSMLVKGVPVYPAGD